jgi:hypothetical protein
MKSIRIAILVLTAGPSFLLVGFAALLAAAPAARAQYTFTNVADTGSPTIDAFFGTTPSLNSAGTLGFFAALDAGGQGLFRGDGSATTTIALTSGPPYAAFGSVSPGSFSPIDAAGTLGFRAELDAGGHGLFRSDGTTTATIALTSSPTFSFLQLPSMNSAGTLGFHASLDGGGEGLFTGDGTTTTTIALTSGPTFSSFQVDPAINSVGTLGFRANLDAGGTGLFTSDGTTTTTIALSSGPTFSSFGNAPSINAAGKLGFHASRDAGGDGVFTSDGTTTTTIALRGLTYSNFASITSLDTAGRLAFNAGLDAGGRGLFIGDGTTTTQVLHTGDALFGSTVVGFAIGREALNDAGQLGFFYQLADGRQGVAVASMAPVITPGDFNSDGKVDGRDFLVWQRNTSVGNLADWQANYGVGSMSASTAVPEPATGGLAFAALVASALMVRK